MTDILYFWVEWDDGGWGLSRGEVTCPKCVIFIRSLHLRVCGEGRCLWCGIVFFLFPCRRLFIFRSLGRESVRVSTYPRLILQRAAAGNSIIILIICCVLCRFRCTYLSCCFVHYQVSFYEYVADQPHVRETQQLHTYIQMCMYVMCSYCLKYRIGKSLHVVGAAGFNDIRAY